MKFPEGVRCTIYSFLPFEILLSKICKISQKERKILVSSEIIDQEKKFVANFGKIEPGWDIAIDLATSVSCEFEKISENVDTTILGKIDEN